MCAVVHVFLSLLKLAVLGRVLYTWVDPTPYPTNRLKAILWSLTEPLLAPLRRSLPPMGMFDFSPVVLLIILLVIDQVTAAVLCAPF
jgi:YggT family protein